MSAVKNRLTDAQYQQVLACIQAIHECRRLEDFPSCVLAALRKVIDCSLAGYNEVDLPRNRIVVTFDPPLPELTPARIAGFGTLMREHPVITYFDRTGDGQALKISDFISAREFHRRAVYREFYKSIEAEDQISFGVQLAPDFLIGVAFNRNRRSFTEKDRLRLNLIRPHIVQAYVRLAEISGHRQREVDLHRALRENGLGIISLDEHGEVVHVTPGTFETLAQYLPVAQTGKNALPPRIKEWLRKIDGKPSAEPLIVSRDVARLIVRYAPSEDRRLLLLSEENSPAHRERLEHFALTNREREVLRWLAEGKANAEIATILGLTGGTVKLYVERILEKLGVENRVMAALVYHGITL